MVKRRAVPARKALPLPTLLLSPRGDMLVVGALYPRTSLTILSTSPRHPWTLAWKAPRGTVQVVGWASGQSLPLIAVQRREDAPAILMQLAKSRRSSR